MSYYVRGSSEARVEGPHELAEVARLVTKLRPHAESFPPENHLTFFELVTALALCWFAEQKCEVVIWETGLGGRLDATNIVTPIASVINVVRPQANSSFNPVINCPSWS